MKASKKVIQLAHFCNNAQARAYDHFNISYLPFGLLRADLVGHLAKLIAEYLYIHGDDLTWLNIQQAADILHDEYNAHLAAQVLEILRY